MNTLDLDSDLLNILTSASKLALNYFGSYKSLKSKRKEDLSPVSEADIAINEFLEEQLKKITPEIPILSEEGSKKISKRNDDSFWLIDPLDGTKEFIKGAKNFSINIALVEQGRSVLGAISEPVEKKIYIGSKSKPARIFKDKKFQNLNPKSISEICVVSVSKSHSNQYEKNFFKNLKQTYPKVEVIEKGSSLKFCDLCVGASDVYPRFGPVYQWDLAAGQAILESLGGEIIFKNTKDEIYKYDFFKKINGFIALASSKNTKKIKKIAKF